MGSSLTFLAGSLELHSFPRLHRGKQSLGVYCRRAALPEGDLLVQEVSQVAEHLTNVISAPEGDPPGSDAGLLPVSKMRKGLEKHVTSRSVEGIVDALPHIPWSYLNPPAAASSSFRTLTAPPHTPSRSLSPPHQSV